jgi:hypothetical protein
MVLLLGICVVPLVECHGLTAPGGSGGTAKRYLTAAQRKDFKTIIDLTSSFQDSIQNIKRNNPQVLWTKLIGQYYDDQAKNLVHDPLLTLVPENAQWSITEQRPVGTNQTTVYATVRYATPADSPIIGQQRLKQGILQLNIFNTTQQVLGVGRVEAADTYWPIPTLNNEEVIQLIKAQLPEMALFPYIRCDFKSPAEPGGIPYCTIRMPQGTTPWLSEYKVLRATRICIEAVQDFGGVGRERSRGATAADLVCLSSSE